VFAKLDVTFGDDLTGVGGKAAQVARSAVAQTRAGMRVNW